MVCNGPIHVTSTAAEQAIAKLRSLQEGDRGIIEVIAVGRATIPALCRLLFEREPSGLYEARCRAVQALAALRAYSVLADFLELSREIVDPVERTGEDAVINAAARALATTRDETYFSLLLSVAAKHPPLAGVIEALGSFRHVDALAYLIDSLAEDFARPAAEKALEALGTRARGALVRTALDQSEAAGGTTESNTRRRIGALNVLMEMDHFTHELSRQLLPLVDDADMRIAILACRLCLDAGPPKDRPRAIRRLLVLLPTADWLQEHEIEDCLRRHLTEAHEQIERRLAGTNIPTLTDMSPEARTIRALRRVLSCQRS